MSGEKDFLRWFELVDLEVCLGTLNGYFLQAVGYADLQFKRGI